MILLLNGRYLFQFLVHSIPWLVFLCLSLLSLTLSLNQLSIGTVLTGSLYLWRMMAYLSLIPIGWQVFTPEFKVKLTEYRWVMIAVTLLFGIVQYVWMPRLESLFILGWDRHAYRLTAAWLDPNFAGLLLVLMFLWMIGERSMKHEVRSTEEAKITTQSIIPSISPVLRFSYFVLLSLTFLAILLTYSRSTYLALGIGAMVYGILKKQWRLMAGLILILAIGLPLLPQRLGEGTKLLRTSTIISRINNYQRDWQLFLDRSLLGYGMNTLTWVKPVTAEPHGFLPPNRSAGGSDNSGLYLLLTSGVLGSTAFIWLLRDLLKYVQQTPVLTSSLVAIGIHGMFTNSWFYPWVVLWVVFVLVETSLVMSSRKRQRSAPLSGIQRNSKSLCEEHQ